MEYYSKTYAMFQLGHDEFPEEEMDYKDRLQENLEVPVLHIFIWSGR